MVWPQNYLNVFIFKLNCGHTKNRRKYYEALDKSDAGDERGFVKFIFDIIINQLKSVSK